MKKEFLKGFTRLMLVVVLAAAGAVASANAQSADKVVADIPFDFSVGYKILPAGRYTVTALSAHDRALLIQSADQNTSVLRLSDPIERAKDRRSARLVFHRYGQRYFLAEVWNGADRTGRQLLKSQEERAVEIEIELASTSAPSEPANDNYETIEVVAQAATQVIAKPR